MRILAISGSLREQSYNTAVLRAAEAVAPAGVEFELYEHLEALPPYNEDRDTDSPPAEVARLRELIAGADAVLISTPEFNGTVPGQLKNAVDWASRPRGSASLLNKLVAVVGASSTDYGAMWAQETLRRSLGIAGARVLDIEVIIPRVQDKIGPDGTLTDTEAVASLLDIIGALRERQQALKAA